MRTHKCKSCGSEFESDGTPMWGECPDCVSQASFSTKVPVYRSDINAPQAERELADRNDRWIESQRAQGKEIEVRPGKRGW